MSPFLHFEGLARYCLIDSRCEVMGAFKEAFSKNAPALLLVRARKVGGAGRRGGAKPVDSVLMNEKSKVDIK